MLDNKKVLTAFHGITRFVVKNMDSRLRGNDKMAFTHAPLTLHEHYYPCLPYEIGKTVISRS